MSDIQNGFSKSYAQARQKFLSAAQAAGLTVDSNIHPLKGRDGEDLAMDVVFDGAPDAQRLLVQEQDAVQRLPLGAGRDALLGGQPRKKSRDLGLPHVARMPLAAPQDEPFGPVPVGLEGAPAVVPDGAGFAHHLLQPLGWHAVA